MHNRILTMATLRPNWFLISPSLIAAGACSWMSWCKCLIPILAVERVYSFVKGQYWAMQVIGVRDCGQQQRWWWLESAVTPVIASRVSRRLTRNHGPANLGIGYPTPHSPSLRHLMKAPRHLERLGLKQKRLAAACRGTMMVPCHHRGVSLRTAALLAVGFPRPTSSNNASVLIFRCS